MLQQYILLLHHLYIWTPLIISKVFNILLIHWCLDSTSENWQYVMSVCAPKLVPVENMTCVAML